MTVRLSPTLAGIRCFACETSHDPRQLLTVCRACGLPLRVDYNLSSVKLSLRDLHSREPSLWRYRELLPLLPGDEVSLVEGLTPLLPVETNVWVKDESRNPTGSFKARGMAVAVSMAKHLGAQALAAPSAGNAAGALAAYGLGLEETFFDERYTGDPTILFRIFNYPRAAEPTNGWGVGEHTDYGFLTLLKQDTVGGLQVRHRDGWLEVPDLPDSFVCNVGDMLERLTRGRYLSALHRVRSSSRSDRMSMALFFDPAFDAVLAPIEGIPVDTAGPHTQVRWDDLDPHAAHRTYGEYLLSKVGRVFPVLREEALQASRDAY